VLSAHLSFAANPTHIIMFIIHTMIPPFGLLWIFIAGFYIEGVVSRPFLKKKKKKKKN
jgi:hypothetical protein